MCIPIKHCFVADRRGVRAKRHQASVAAHISARPRLFELVAEPAVARSKVDLVCVQQEPTHTHRRSMAALIGPPPARVVPLVRVVLDSDQSIRPREVELAEQPAAGVANRMLPNRPREASP
jgi:hypothetical protein